MATGVIARRHLDVVAGHDHLNAFGQLDRAGHVRGADVELGPVAGEERRVAAALVLGQHVDLSLELVCGLIELGLARTWPRSMSSRSIPRSRQPTLSPASPWSRVFWNISTPVTTVLRVSLDADDFDFVADLDDAALDTAGDDGAAALDAEDVFDGHEERAGRAGRSGVGM